MSFSTALGGPVDGEGRGRVLDQALFVGELEVHAGRSVRVAARLQSRLTDESIKDGSRDRNRGSNGTQTGISFALTDEQRERAGSRGSSRRRRSVRRPPSTTSIEPTGRRRREGARGRG